MEAINGTIVTEIDDESEIRLAVVFCDGEGLRAYSIYLEREYRRAEGCRGYVDGHTVKVSGALLDWLERTIR